MNFKAKADITATYAILLTSETYYQTYKAIETKYNNKHRKSANFNERRQTKKQPTPMWTIKLRHEISKV